MPNPSWACLVDISETLRSGFAPLSIHILCQESHPEINRPAYRYMNVRQLQQCAKGIVRKRSLLLNSASVSWGNVHSYSLFFHCHPEWTELMSFETAVPLCTGWIVCLGKKFIRKICKPGLTCQILSNKLASVLKHKFFILKVCEINGKSFLSTIGEKSSTCQR